MFFEAPCRDDYQLKIVKSVKDTTDVSVNFLVLPSGKNPQTSVVLNHYKTDGNKDDAVWTVLTKQTSALVVLSPNKRIFLTISTANSSQSIYEKKGFL